VSASVIPEWPEQAELSGDCPPGLPEGEFTMTQFADGTLRIDHADPRIMISAELIDMAARGELEPGATLSPLDFTIPNGHAGALLKIRAANRQVVYRLTRWVPEVRGYVAERPE
jgi:hypothetical protein